MKPPLVLLSCIAFGTSAFGGTDPWQATLETVEKSVVSLEVTATRDFDTEDADTVGGTGFVVDAQRGLILTNRHLVNPGPVVAKARLASGEWVPLQVVYRDPVHDFGFFHYDPSAVEYERPPALTLAPDAAEVGMNIRVVGNDAGEQNAILDGTLAQLDRNAPRYGRDTYNDFNTFYFQAASNTSGGSSGSPVVDVLGRVVALNAGGASQAASSFYLPLHAVQRVLRHLQRGEDIARGTLQTTLQLKGYGDLDLLGVTREGLDSFRQTFPGASGALVVASTVPGGPSDGELMAGDVVLSLQGKPLGDFDTLERTLDERVGRSVTLGIQRGGKAREVTLIVGDLHAITPDRYLEVGRAVLNEVSYQQARSHSVPVGGPYVASPGYMFSTAGVPEGSVITHIDGEPVDSIHALRVAFESKSAGQRLRVRFHFINEPRHPMERVMSMERRWFPMRECRWHAPDGSWPCTESPPPPEPAPRTKVTSTIRTPATTKLERRISSSLVTVSFDIPYPTAGISDLHYVGVGAILDVERGLVIVDRDTVPVALGDVMVTIAGTIRVPGELVFLHPVYNYAVVQFDSSAVGPGVLAPLAFIDTPMSAGDPIWQVGLNRDQQLVSRKTTVWSHQWLDLSMASTPRFRASNTDAIVLDSTTDSLGGVLTDKKGRVVALWSSFLDAGENERYMYGLPTVYFHDVVRDIIAGQLPDQRLLGIETRPIGLADAVEFGMSMAQVERIVQAGGQRARWVSRVVAGSGADGVLRVNDILLSIENSPAFRSEHLLIHEPVRQVLMTVLRDGEEHTVAVPVDVVDGNGVSRCVSWAGLVLHESHREVASQTGVAGEGVYIAWLWYGSPAVKFGIRPTRRIVAVNETPTPDLDSFVTAVHGLPNGTVVRLALEGLDGQRFVRPIELDTRFWPTEVFERLEGTWTRTTHGE